MDCSHLPIHGALDLETALAASCNNWFAQAARRLEGLTVQRTVQSFGGRAAAATPVELCLVVLGLERIWFTPNALAKAYARLRREGAPAVIRGLEGAVRRGTAMEAGGGSLILAGKTGTVRNGGWFAGWSDAAVIAVFVRGGTGGGDAAPEARRILAEWHGGLAG
jgi:membrane carboxypeptidase/penicillin-binding protein